MKKRSKTSKLFTPLLWIVTAVFLAGLGWLVLLGQYIRPYQDDFYYYPPANYTEMRALLNERYNWTGRFTTTTIQLVFGWSQTHWIVPLISFAVMVGGIYAFSNIILVKLVASKLRRYSAALALATGLTLAIFLVTPSPYSSMFWLSAAPIHFWSYGLILLYLSYLLKRLSAKVKIYDYVIMLAGPLIIGMMGEVAMFALAGGVMLVFIYACLSKAKNILLLAAANIVGLGVAFYELFFSTGAVIRRGSENSVPTAEVIKHAPRVVFDNLYALATSLLNNKLVLIVVLLVAVIIGMSLRVKKMNLWRTFAALVGIAVVYVGVMCLNFVGVYSSVKLEVAWDRTQAFSVIVIIGLLMLYGVVGGMIARQYLEKRKVIVNLLRGVVLLLVVMIIGLEGAYVPYINRFANAVHDRAVAFDARERTIKTLKNSQCPIIVPETTIAGVQEGQDIWDNPKHPLNVGVQRYYRLACPVVQQR